MSKGRAGSKARRDLRYRAAVLRQIALIKCGWYINSARPDIRCEPAPVEEFLRKGDSADHYSTDEES